MANIYPAGKKRVCYYYDGTLFFEHCFSSNVEYIVCVLWEGFPLSIGKICFLNAAVVIVCHAIFYLCLRWCWQLLLWPRASYETTSYTYDSQFTPKLWIVQKNGDLCEFTRYGYHRYPLGSIVVGYLCCSKWSLAIQSFYCFKCYSSIFT